jgi:hypothetical protein
MAIKPVGRRRGIRFGQDSKTSRILATAPGKALLQLHALASPFKIVLTIPRLSFSLSHSIMDKTFIIRSRPGARCVMAGLQVWRLGQKADGNAAGVF